MPELKTNQNQEMKNTDEKYKKFMNPVLTKRDSNSENDNDNGPKKIKFVKK